MTEPGWKSTTTNRYIGYMDILGFKDMMAREGGHEKGGETLTQVANIIATVTNAMTNAASGSIKRSQYIDISRIRSVSFSDSILFVSQSDTFDDLITLASVMEMLQERTLQQSIPIKGAISYGYLTADFPMSIFYGQPLIDAFLLQEQLHYYGIVLDNWVESKVKAFELKSEAHRQVLEEIFIKCETPFKDGKITHYNLILDADHIEELYNKVSGKIRKYVDNTASMFKEMSEIPKAVTMRRSRFNLLFDIETSNKNELNEKDRIKQLVDIQSLAFDEVYAATIDVKGYYERFWMGEIGESFIQSNILSAKRGAIIKRIFIMDIGVYMDSENEKHEHFRNLIMRLNQGCPKIELFFMDITIFKNHYRDIPDHSFFISDEAVISVSGIGDDGISGYVVRSESGKYKEFKDRFESLVVNSKHEAFRI